MRILTPETSRQASNDGMEPYADLSLPAVDLASPWLRVFDPQCLDQALRPREEFRELLNRAAILRSLYNAASRPLCFVPQQALPRDVPYERHIYRTGEIPTRDNLHDRFNALIWQHFPLTKARLNLLHSARLTRDGVHPQRGAQGDALTLFDESGVILVTQDADVADALRNFRWQTLFGDLRERFHRHVKVVVFGHGLLEQMTRPYKGLTGHAVILDVSPDLSMADLDASLALEFGPGVQPKAFCPIPVLGVPGWWPENEDPVFYQDTAVFRPGRRAKLQLVAK